MKGLDYVLKTFKFVDSSKLCGLGASYGGYMVNLFILKKKKKKKKKKSNNNNNDNNNNNIIIIIIIIIINIITY